MTEGLWFTLEEIEAEYQRGKFTDPFQEKLWRLRLLDDWRQMHAALAEMTEARDALFAAYSVLATNRDAQQAALTRIVDDETERIRARAACLPGDKPGVTDGE